MNAEQLNRSDPVSLFRRLAAINRAITTSLDFDEVLRLIIASACELVEGKVCLLLLTDGDGQLRIRAHTAGVWRFDDETVRQFSAPMEESVIDRLREWLGLAPSEAIVAVPVVTSNSVNGVLAVARQTPLAPEEYWLLAALADQAAIALGNARLHEAEVGSAVRERDQSLEALRNSEQRLALASQAAQIGTFEWNIQTGQVAWSAEEEALYGLPPGGFGGQYRNWRQAVHPEDRERAEQDVLRAVTEGTDLDTEFRVVWPDGSVRWLAARGRTFRDRNGAPWRMIGVNLDITERKRAEQEREQLLTGEQQARHKAEEASRLKDEFLATVSHELRTPLSSILGWIRLLKTGRLDGTATAQALDTIDRNAKAQAQLINDLLDVSRIISGKLRLQFGPVDLATVAREAVAVVRPTADAKQVRIETAFAPEKSLVFGDADRLQQVAWNLLTNAVKFTPAGGQVTVRLRRVDNQLCLQVSDTGAGISPEFLPFVFDRFRQADGSTTRLHSGLGLGLAIVRHLVEAHGGTVRADSPGQGQGATFTVQLPPLAVADSGHRKAEEDFTASPDSEAASSNSQPATLAGVRVLVVDDQADARTLLTVMLEQCGAVVQTAASAAEGLAVLAAWQPAVLVSDIGMPEEDGYNLIREVRARPAGQGGQTPAVALTAYASKADRERALAAGFQEHLPKPADLEFLAAVVARLAGRTG